MKAICDICRRLNEHYYPSGEIPEDSQPFTISFDDPVTDAARMREHMDEAHPMAPVRVYTVLTEETT